MQFLNYKSPPLALAETIASIHEGIPLDWDPFRITSPNKVSQTKAKLQSEDQIQTIIVALKEHQLVGFHWIAIREEKAFVLSTWVDQSYRQLGIAKSLKQKGEDWVKEQNKSELVSKVHYKNLNMQSLNIECGYNLIGQEKEFSVFQKKI